MRAIKEGTKRYHEEEGRPRNWSSRLELQHPFLNHKITLSHFFSHPFFFPFDYLFRSLSPFPSVFGGRRPRREERGERPWRMRKQWGELLRGPWSERLRERAKERVAAPERDWERKDVRRGEWLRFRLWRVFGLREEGDEGGERLRFWIGRKEMGKKRGLWSWRELFERGSMRWFKVEK